MRKLLITGDILPSTMSVAEVFSMVQFTGTVEISERGTVVGLFERKRTNEQDIIDQFAASAPSEANAIVGVQVSTATHRFGELSYLYITYVGTPVLLVQV